VLSSEQTTNADAAGVTISASTIADTYYLLIEATSTSSSSLLTGDYVVTSNTSTGLREFEPNGSIATATSVTIGGSELRGDLSSTTDKDYFKFTSSGGVVQFTGRPATVINYSSNGFMMSILDSTGNVLSSEQTTNADAAGVTISASTIAGTYYLLIEATSTSSSSLLTGDYVVTSTTSTGSREFEPNGSIATATSITIGGSELRGDLSSVTDKDYFKFTSPGSVVQFTGRPATVIIYSSNGFKMTILDSAGNVLSSKPTTNADAAGVTISASTIAATYYLLIEATSTSNSSLLTGDYVVTSPSIAKFGDCDRNGLVTIAEVQSAINMFLGLKAFENCVDTDNSGQVSIAEVQKAINAFLGL
jgi:hypothetical protein